MVSIQWSQFQRLVKGHHSSPRLINTVRFKLPLRTKSALSWLETYNDISTLTAISIRASTSIWRAPTIRWLFSLFCLRQHSSILFWRPFEGSCGEYLRTSYCLSVHREASAFEKTHPDGGLSRTCASPTFSFLTHALNLGLTNCSGSSQFDQAHYASRLNHTIVLASSSLSLAISLHSINCMKSVTVLVQSSLLKAPPVVPWLLSYFLNAMWNFSLKLRKVSISWAYSSVQRACPTIPVDGMVFNCLAILQKLINWLRVIILWAYSLTQWDWPLHRLYPSFFLNKLLQCIWNAVWRTSVCEKTHQSC